MRNIQRAIGVVGLLGASACATIIDGKNQAMTIQSVPPQAAIVISNRSGTEIHTGVTPVTLPLKRGAGYFSSEKYEIAVSKNGFQPVTVPLTGKVTGWYAANVLFGGLLGLLIIDPATGAMYQLAPEDLDAAVIQPPYRYDSKADVLTVMLADQIPAAILQTAVPLNAAAIAPAPPIEAITAAQPVAEVPRQIAAPPQAAAQVPVPVQVQRGSQLVNATPFRANPRVTTLATLLPAGTRYELRGQADNSEGSWWFIAIDHDIGWIPAQAP